MATNSKNAFWQALIVTVAIFLIGIFIGIVIEENRASKANDAFISSELSLMDSLALSNLIQISEGGLSCELIIETNINFANKIYEEAVLFEKYGNSEKLTDNIKIVLKRYDLLRTLLWINTLSISEDCLEKTSTSTIVYLFQRDPKSLEKKSLNNVWQKLLFDLKQKKGNSIILIPIGHNEDIDSLKSLTEKFKIQEYPALIINNKDVIQEVVPVKEIEKYLR